MTWEPPLNNYLANVSMVIKTYEPQAGQFPDLFMVPAADHPGDLFPEFRTGTLQVPALVSPEAFFPHPAKNYLLRKITRGPSPSG